ncbi:hypothetical protein [Chitinophaga agri]|uniref:Uncharacterized protein n=1 Tax=Chitinophaga agri TaxID=2703787 RepID=A0A6B9ZAM3_9BACT|nr:hypothetical protein [Chitinophaga agri]QHS59400.1 hypothetical protein GWR21_07315 [Chitinophaga agri]
MYNRDENLLNVFGNTALSFLNAVYAEFLFSIKYVDRRKNEHLVQSSTMKYMDKLRMKLEEKAREYIATNRDLLTIDWFHKKLVYLIKQYLQEFLQRTQYLAVAI